MAATQPAKLGNIEFDAIIERDETMSSDVPEYATEAGYSVADNVCLKPVELNVTACFSNAPVTWGDRHSASSSRVESMIEEVRQLWKNRQPVTFTAAGSSWDNMAVVSCTIPKKPGHSNKVNIQFKLRQITITSSETTTISASYARGGESKQNTGAAQRSSSSTEKNDGGSSSGEEESRTSLLCAGAKAIGIFK